MKKALSLMLAFVMIAALACAIPMEAFAKEDAPEPAAISDAAGFAAMVPNGIYYLAADITVSETYLTEFTGSFDGKGHKITTSAPLFELFSGTATDLVIEGAVTTNRDRGGVFANTLGAATLSKIVNKANLTGSASKVSGEDALELNGVYGGIAGTSLKKVELVVNDCANYGNVSGYNAGGLFGKIHADIKLSGLTNYGTVTGGDCGGGVIGWEYGDGSIEKAVNHGTVTNTTEYAGGVISYVSGSTNLDIKDCLNDGALTSSDSGAGGIVGRAGDKCELVFENCVNKGKLTGSGDRTGGICGRDQGLFTAKNCFNYGELFGLKQAGGIVAAIGCDDKDGVSTIEFCGNEGKVSTEKDTCAGIIAYAQGSSAKILKVHYCYNTGDIKGGCEASGIVGYVNACPAMEVSNCYNMGKISTTDTNEKPLAIYFNKASAKLADDAVKGNMYLKDCAEKEARLNADGYSDMNSDLTLDDFKSGKVCYLMNQAAGKEVFFQTIGTDNFPKLDGKASKSVKLEDGKYVNDKAPVTPPATGDNAVIIAVVALVSVMGFAVVIRKNKVNC